ncbi:DHH family phosphohydrolase [Catovirus CTV1]|uniref:DHH family phosphohydrolase n=1 Tax=Catovirus CTV1 TaxID=1977631 RepID=A0A1V0SBP6_9VIRU|nr:DHH family phosphohydrolase [Catovirus CTV1]
MELKFDHLIIKPEDVDVVIYHSNCADGFGCVISAELYRKNKLPNKEITYYPASYNKPPPEISGKNVLICDFSYKSEVMLKLISQAAKLAIMDHHKTAEEELSKIPDQNKVFNMNFSGAYICWKFFHGNSKVPKLIEYIQDNDLWRKQLPNTLEFTAYMFSIPMTIEEYSKLLDDEYIEKYAIEQGAGMVKQNQSNIEMALKYVAPKFMEINNKYYFVGYINSSILKSELGNRIFDKYPFCNFSVAYSIDDISNSTMFSLRSTNDRTDVSKIAELFGGGGHRNAAGLKQNYISNVIPGRILDNYKCYYLLDNVYMEELIINDIPLKAVILNSSYCKYALGKYLLQTRYTYNEKSVQECAYIMCNHNQSYEDYNCDISMVWNYEGNLNKIWCTTTFSEEIVNDRGKSKIIIDYFSKLDDYENKDNKIVFSCKYDHPITNLFIKN